MNVQNIYQIYNHHYNIIPTLIYQSCYISSLLFLELTGNIFRNFGPLSVSVGSQQHCVTVVQEDTLCTVTVVQDGTLCADLTVRLLNYRIIGGDGDSGEIPSSRS